MKYQLFINGGEVLRIENSNFYVLKEDYMIQTTKKQFKEELKKYKNVCLNTWCEDIKKQYLTIVNYLK